jgi:hypothetical protein
MQQFGDHSALQSADAEAAARALGSLSRAFLWASRRSEQFGHIEPDFAAVATNLNIVKPAFVRCQ